MTRANGLRVTMTRGWANDAMGYPHVASRFSGVAHFIGQISGLPESSEGIPGINFMRHACLIGAKKSPLDHQDRRACASLPRKAHASLSMLYASSEIFEVVRIELRHIANGVDVEILPGDEALVLKHLAVTLEVEGALMIQGSEFRTSMSIGLLSANVKPRLSWGVSLSRPVLPQLSLVSMPV